MRQTFTVAEFEVQKIRDLEANGRLNVDVAYQRNQVWSDQRKQLLIDTLVRGLPFGIVTLFKYFDPEKREDVYEVIDGKQRITTILSYMKSEFQIPTDPDEMGDKDAIALNSESSDDSESESEDDEDVISVHVGQESRKNYAGKIWGDLPSADQTAFFEIQIPAFVVTSKQRNLAVDVFVRMNKNAVGLTPQEIRNAVFHESKLLQMAIDISNEQSKDLGANAPLSSRWWVTSGLMSPERFKRMADIEFMLEILSMTLNDKQPLNRRDDLTNYCSRFSAPKGNDKTLLEGAERIVADAFKKLKIIFPMKFSNVSIAFKGQKAFHDVYAILCALMNYEKSASVIKSNAADYQQAIGKMKDASAFYIRAKRGSDGVTVEAANDRYRIQRVDEHGNLTIDDEFAVLADRYSGTFLGGQENSKSKRKIRVEVWLAVLEGVLPSNDNQRAFTSIQRHLIWELSDKKCGRCGKQVEDKNYWDAGHIKPHSLGGKTRLSNGRVEHVECNRSAKDD